MSIRSCESDNVSVIGRWRPFGWDFWIRGGGVAVAATLAWHDELNPLTLLILGTVVVAITLLPELLAWHLLRSTESYGPLVPLESPDLAPGESILRDEPVYFVHDGMARERELARLWVTTQRIIVLPPRRSWLRGLTFLAATGLYRRSFPPGYARRRVDFELANITLVRRALGMIQIKFEGWTITLVEDRFPWWTSARSEAQEQLLADIERAVQASRVEKVG